jgi:hypothetical protein
MTESKYEEDVKVFNNFLAECKARTLTDAHPVMVMTDHWSKVVAKKYDCDSCQREDIKQATLLSLLSESNYEGRCSLKNYIVRVLVSKVSIVKAPPVKGPRKPKKGEDSDAEERIVFKYIMLDDHTDEAPVIELADERSENLVDKVLSRLAYDELMESKIASMPELQRVIVEIVIEFEENLGSRRIAEEAAKRLERKVTRYQVEIALAQLAIIVSAALWRS